MARIDPTSQARIQDALKTDQAIQQLLEASMKNDELATLKKRLRDILSEAKFESSADPASMRDDFLKSLMKLVSQLLPLPPPVQDNIILYLASSLKMQK